MANKKEIKFHPATYVKDYMDVTNIKQDDFAEKINLSKETFEKFLNEEVNVDENLAKELSHATGTSKEFWLNIQNDYTKWKEQRIKNTRRKKVSE